MWPRGSKSVCPGSSGSGASYSSASKRATASLTAASSPVSATKSIHTSPPRAAATVGASFAPLADSTATTDSSSAAGASGIIHVRESMFSVAIAEASRWRRCPQNAVNPNQAMARG